jgi:sporulation protein YunB
MKRRYIFKPVKKKRKHRGYAFLIFMGIIIVAVAMFFTGLDKRMLPTALKAADMMAKSKVNEAINDSVTTVIESNSLKSDNFYELSVGQEGKINSLSVNTVLINQICNKIALDISANLNSLTSDEIEIPYGTLTGIKALSNIGPSYSLSVMPMGEAVVDYSSSFESVGINQVNFQIWLNVDSKIQIINPLQNHEVLVTRKIPLVNTVINSEVPETYFNISENMKKVLE